MQDPALVQQAMGVGFKPFSEEMPKHRGSVARGELSEISIGRSIFTQTVYDSSC